MHNRPHSQAFFFFSSGFRKFLFFYFFNKQANKSNSICICSFFLMYWVCTKLWSDMLLPFPEKKQEIKQLQLFNETPLLNVWTVALRVNKKRGQLHKWACKTFWPCRDFMRQSHVSQPEWEAVVGSVSSPLGGVQDARLQAPGSRLQVQTDVNTAWPHCQAQCQPALTLHVSS